MNRRDGRPIVEIRCAATDRGRICGKPLGGVWNTDSGTIVTVNRLKPRESVRHFQAVAQRRDKRQGTWQEQGFTLELPVAHQPQPRGAWHLVETEDGVAPVRCPRHGTWALDMQAVQERVARWRSTWTLQTMGTVPPEKGARPA